MATQRLSMRQTREILRQRLFLQRSYREISRSLGLSLGAAATAVRRAQAEGLDWPAVEALNDAELEARIYRRAALPQGERPVPDCVYLHTELHKPGVTLELLHQEYLEQHPETGYRYTQFCEFYRQWREPPSPDDAADPPRRRESLRRLFGQEALLHRSGHRGTH